MELAVNDILEKCVGGIVVPHFHLSFSEDGDSLEGY